LAENIEQVVGHLFRSEYGRLVAALTRYFGPSNIQLAEDVVQETLVSALNNWSVGGIPANPQAWLFTVARRKALNEVERNKMIRRHHHVNTPQLAGSTNIDAIFLEEEIQDSQLRMIFTCCHPSLGTKSQIALTLKTLCGFGVKEVARALLSNESSINKKLYRAKQKIRNSQAAFDIPQGKALDERLDTVTLAMYLLFNEGYNSTSGDLVIQKELCLEAIRLTKLLLDNFEGNRRLCALLSLMCLHTARFDARVDHSGTIVLFEDQDRSLWNQDLINIGLHYFKRSINDATLSPYHIEARIAAEHCLSKSFDQTDWQVIYDQYTLLHKLKPNPIILLNLAIIKSKLQGIEAGLSELQILAENQILANYHWLPATQGVFYMQLKNYGKALPYLKKSLELKPSDREASFIRGKIAKCEELLTPGEQD